jgi:hypothetical protein
MNCETGFLHSFGAGRGLRIRGELAIGSFVLLDEVIAVRNAEPPSRSTCMGWHRIVWDFGDGLRGSINLTLPRPIHSSRRAQLNSSIEVGCGDDGTPIRF